MDNQSNYRPRNHYTPRKKRRHIRWDRVFFILMFKSCGKHESGDSSSLNELTPATSVSDTAATSTTSTSATSGTSGSGSSTALTTADETAAPVLEPVNRTYTVVLDPGHGGKDGGAVSKDKSRAEKDDDLRMALAVRDQLLKHPRIQVIMTRDTDVVVSLAERCRIANEAQADFFISLHRNSAESGSGVEIWVNNNSTDNALDKLLAGYILERINMVGVSANRGVQLGYRGSSAETVGNNYYVNRNTNMPSCLVELGFMSSEEDNNLFDDRFNEYAEAIATAIIEIGTDKRLYSPEAQ